MYIDVDIQNSIMILEEFKDGKHDVVDIAEPTCFLLLCMVQAACPVDGDVCRLVVQFDCCID